MKRPKLDDLPQRRLWERRGLLLVRDSGLLTRRGRTSLSSGSRPRGLGPRRYRRVRAGGHAHDGRQLAERHVVLLHSAEGHALLGEGRHLALVDRAAADGHPPRLVLQVGVRQLLS